MKLLQIAILLIGFSFSTAAQEAPVKMTFSQDHIELGEVKRGEKKEMIFEFTNDGDTAISIDLVSSCECTTLDYSQRAYEPGESGKINVLFDSTEKEESESVDVDVILKNIDPKTDAPVMIFLSYSFELL